MMREAFLQECQQATDWLPWLIFADWLEEQGSPEAEMIRATTAGNSDEVLRLYHQGVFFPNPRRENSLGMKFNVAALNQALLQGLAATAWNESRVREWWNAHLEGPRFEPQWMEMNRTIAPPG